MLPARHRSVEIGGEALDVGVGRKQTPAVVPERVGGADRTRAIVRLRHRQRRLLVRDRDVGADIAALGQMRDEIGERLRRDLLAPVGGVEIVLLDPIAVDQRRARMPDRPADHACGSRAFTPSLSLAYAAQ